MRQRALVVLLFILCLIAVGQAHAQSSGNVLLLQVEGPVTPAMAEYFARGIQSAEDQGATAVVIQLDTPGGAIDTTQEIVQTFRAATVPVIIYVAPRGAQAASAGSIITIAAHAAGMAPETVIGAASPVGQDGAELDATLFRKVTEDMKAQVRSLAARRGPEAVALAEAMISDARAVHAEEALVAGLIDAIASDVPNLLSQLDGRTVIVNDQTVTLHTAGETTRPFGMSLVEAILHALSNPVLVSILLAIGVQAILIEISHPGGWVAGFVGVVFLALALYGLGQLPANWFGLGLILVAFVLFLLEVKAPVHGALAVTGIITMFAGFMVLFNSPGTPAFARLSIISAILITLPTAAFFIFLVFMVLRAQRRKPITGEEGLIGQKGTVRKAIVTRPGVDDYAGMVQVQGELWRAAARDRIDEGEEVEVTAVQGFTLQVKRV
ncbi:MAG: nodulation protein NfeD [Ardenticatenaceae bacterium]|nr:nodulation protein NfeD [Ardenticatenaceae bacterium]MCB8987936.1 nodulation protein NfeD [Ardenticatenaceae bacterium]